MVTVFGYIAVAQTLVVVLSLVMIAAYIFKTSREETLRPSIGQGSTRRQRQAVLEARRKSHAKTILKALTLPIIVLVGLTATRWLTAEIVVLPNGVTVNTNRIDARFCQTSGLLQCAVIRIRCDEFTKLPDGRWKSSADATLIYPQKPGSFSNNEFGIRGFVINGIDLAAYLDQVCGSPTK